MRLLAFALLFFGFSLPIAAQVADKRIEQIDHLHTQVDELIAIGEKEAPYSDVFVAELAVNKTGNSYPAVGTYSNVTRFHYTFGDREASPYPNRLLKASVVTKRAASITTSEFVYNAAGQLVFGLVRTDGEEQRETRLYFAAGDPKGGAVLHGPRLFGQPTCHHAPEIYPEIGEKDAADMLREFFRERRT